MEDTTPHYTTPKTPTTEQKTTRKKIRKKKKNSNLIIKPYNKTQKKTPKKTTENEENNSNHHKHNTTVRSARTPPPPHSWYPGGWPGGEGRQQAAPVHVPGRSGRGWTQVSRGACLRAQYTPVTWYGGCWGLGVSRSRSTAEPRRREGRRRPVAGLTSGPARGIEGFAAVLGALRGSRSLATLVRPRSATPRRHRLRKMEISAPGCLLPRRPLCSVRHHLCFDRYLSCK
ncbi:hypothetical protein E2C01_004050 [Portunus trituberculatus]|uniref:Uncharacterized protein n=1 Tax=Portunus trituberculatus TaxID=210409 RepID=A0A5B7CNU5_PORTR|nr:hypothetical protein [Portunus trituberculatus]